MRSFVVTGAEGFVGGYLLKALREHYPAAEIVGTSHTAASPTLDVTDAEQVSALMARLRPDVCIHLAAIASVNESFQTPRAALDVNLHGTLNVAEACFAANPECHLVYASSGEIYGLSVRDGTPVGEDTPLYPANPYAVAKAAADLALGEMALRGLRVTRLRLFNHTGPGQSDRFVLPQFAAQVARIAAGVQEPIIRTGALDRWRDFLDIRDVVDAYLAAIRAPATGLCVNICSGVPRRVGDALAALLDLAGVRAEIVERASEIRPTDIRTSVGSPRRAFELWGWRAGVAWHDTLNSLLAYWRTRVDEREN